jgi:hypothetical protein
VLNNQSPGRHALNRSCSLRLDSSVHALQSNTAIMDKVPLETYGRDAFL